MDFLVTHTTTPQRERESRKLNFFFEKIMEIDEDNSTQVNGSTQQPSSIQNSQNLPSSSSNANNTQIAIPSTSAWFSTSKIHEIEKRALPDFFDGKNPSKTPELFVLLQNIFHQKMDV